MLREGAARAGLPQPCLRHTIWSCRHRVYLIAIVDSALRRSAILLEMNMKLLRSQRNFWRRADLSSDHCWSETLSTPSFKFSLSLHHRIDIRTSLSPQPLLDLLTSGLSAERDSMLRHARARPAAKYMSSRLRRNFPASSYRA